MTAKSSRRASPPSYSNTSVRVKKSRTINKSKTPATEEVRHLITPEVDPRFRDDCNEFRAATKRPSSVTIVPRNRSQEHYLSVLENRHTHITFAIGPAGTGKTRLAVQMAIKDFKENRIKKIVITRPAVSVDEDHGFLPGTLNQKMEPWTRPIMDVFEEYYAPRQIAEMLELGVIEIAPLAMMRGRTFKHAFIVADECQNTTANQMKMLLTRIGDGSKLVVTGDLNQADRPTENGLLDFVNLFRNYEGDTSIEIVTFQNCDIERHPVVKEVLAIYGGK